MSSERIAAGALGLSLVTALVLVVLWAANSLASKAPADKVQSLEIRMSRVEANEAWTMGAVYELAKHQGVVVPPPPSP